MAIHDLKLAAREEVAADTLAFHFEKPAGFAFKPGQAIDLIQPGPAGEPPARHAFSLVSAPHEPALTIATRMRDSAFKRALRALPVGAVAQADGPFGSMTLHSNRARPAVMIAGGIGITPFVSCVRQAAHDGWPQHLIMLYSNRRPEDAAFLDELQRYEQGNSSFRLIPTMTQAGHEGLSWAGHAGHIDAPLLRAVAADLAAPIYYLAGPPPMVQGVRQALSEAGVEDDDIRSEEFFGY